MINSSNCTTPADGVCPPNSTLCPGSSCQEQGKSFNQILNQVLSIILPILLNLVILSMGCTTDIRKLWGHIRRPWAIIVGFLCQFGIMPFTAFILSKAFNVLPVQALVIIIMGCCPGGSFSNIVAYWLDGDMDLSISMTACSTSLAMGMMPLCLLIYTSGWTSGTSIQIPYKRLGLYTFDTITTPCLIIEPVGFCNMNKKKKPQISKYSVGSMVGLPLIIIATVMSCIVYKNSWSMSTSMWIIGIILPLLGYSLGFLMARILRQPWKRCRTIALETGVQNASLCGTITQLSFSREERMLVFAFPIIYSLSQIFFSLVAVGGMATPLISQHVPFHGENISFPSIKHSLINECLYLLIRNVKPPKVQRHV
uniref:Ileal sodium/bile acid cotransporter n=1 Tax=Scleropages formosus TaxID=113540 RepID=A0A8C9RW73_SCLFO